MTEDYQRIAHLEIRLNCGEDPSHSPDFYGVMRLRYIVDNNLIETEASLSQLYSIRLSVRTAAFQAVKSGSTPLSSTKGII